MIYTRRSIENTFKLVRDISEELAYNNEFSFEALNRRISNGAHQSLNMAFQTRIAELKKEKSIGNMNIYQNVLNNIEKFAGNNISMNAFSID
ncbi:MAG: hypothetical protein LIO79_00380 [Rikenellaceae bacterium]|nr:hypothetical protein [Rikenellaceae bacterium]